MLQKVLAAAIVALIGAITALVLYVPPVVSVPRAAPVRMPSGLPLGTVPPVHDTALAASADRTAPVGARVGKGTVVPAARAAAAGQRGARAADALRSPENMRETVVAAREGEALPSAPERPPLAATQRTGSALVADAPVSGDFSVRRPRSHSAMPRAGRTVASALATAGRQIGSAFQRAF